MADLLRANIARQSLLEFASARLASLLRALNAENDAIALQPLLARLAHPWGYAAVGHQPRYRSYISDDEFPVEFSVGFSNGSYEVQFYVEPQGDPPNVISNMQAGKRLLAALAPEPGICLDRLQLVDDLFFPEAPQPPFTLWIGVSWSSETGIRFKAYLNPQVHGAGRSLANIGEALQRFGFRQAWSSVTEVLRAQGCKSDVGILSLDLSRHANARVKIYIRHYDSGLREIEKFASLARDYNPADCRRFYSALAGHSGPYDKRATQTELSFVDPECWQPASVTLEFPIGTYVDNDESARQRVSNCLNAFGLSEGPYSRCVHAFATRPLHAHGGIHSHVTFRRINAQPRIAVYWAGQPYDRVQRVAACQCAQRLDTYSRNGHGSARG